MATRAIVIMVKGEETRHLLEPEMVQILQDVLEEGHEKKKKSWRCPGELAADEHIRRALVHICKSLDGMTDEAHLEHAFCRLMMAIDTKRREEKDGCKGGRTNESSGKIKGFLERLLFRNEYEN